MPEDNDRSVIPSKRGLLGDITIQIKLILRLISDPRVSPLLKLLPIGALVYLVVPDIFLGPLDDAAVIWLGSYLFVELCPPEVVQEHMAALNLPTPGQPHDPLEEDDNIVEGEYWEER